MDSIDNHAFRYHLESCPLDFILSTRLVMKRKANIVSSLKHENGADLANIARVRALRGSSLVGTESSPSLAGVL